MANANIEAGLRQLGEGLREIRSLLASADLAESETRRDTPPSFRFDHHFGQDLVTQCGIFVNTDFDLREVMGFPFEETRPTGKRRREKQRLLRLEREFRELQFAARFIKA
jgi:hypothetical protein